MVRQNTTFVIGAGASVPWGLPVGEKLVTRVMRMSDSPNAEPARLTRNGGVTPQELDAFCRALKASRVFSIDAFIESRPNFRRVGITAMAVELMSDYMKVSKDLTPTTTDGQGQDWIRYILDEICSGCRCADDLRVNRVSFITFNFDRILERYLDLAVRARFGALPGGASTFGEVTPILHIHGSLPDAIGPDGEGLKVAVDQLHVISDEIPADVVAQASQAIDASERICFLGFGFHPLNTTRLGLNDPRTTGGKTLFGSAFGLEAGEQERARASFRFPPRSVFLGGPQPESPLTLGDPKHDCLQFLRHNPVFA